MVDWASVFVPDKPLLEIVVRGTVVYLALFAMLRLIVKREVGTLGVTDILVLVLIADAAQNAMADEYRSVPDGIVLVATILAWSFVLDWLAYRSAFLRRVLRPPPVQIVRNGRMLRRALAREKITEDELLGELRRHGYEDVRDVHAAYIEADGAISVIARGGRARNFA